jgi:DNA-binding CsgD family transcriptional regulator
MLQFKTLATLNWRREVNVGTRAVVKPEEVKGNLKGYKGVRRETAAHPHALGSYAGGEVKTARMADGPRFTAEEGILLRRIASGSSVKEIAGQLRLPRESLYRLMGDLRRKTGATDDTALAVWALRNMGTLERRGGDR